MLIAGRSSEAIAVYHRSLALVEKIRERNPTDPEVEQQWQRARQRLANAQQR
jgi:hypothetical protein